MLLHSGIINLNYSPAQDILETNLPDIKQLSLMEVDYCLELIVRSIREYDIKNLLLDSSNSVLEVDGEAYRAVTTKFSVDLMGTRLEKLARVVTADAEREVRSAEAYANVRQELNPSIEFRNFTTKEAAMEWLLSK